MKELIKYLIARLDESGTWASIGVFLGAMGIHMPPGLWQDATLVGTAIAAGAGVLIREKGKVPVDIAAKDIADEIIKGLQQPKVS